MTNFQTPKTNHYQRIMKVSPTKMTIKPFFISSKKIPVSPFNQGATGLKPLRQKFVILKIAVL